MYLGCKWKYVVKRFQNDERYYRTRGKCLDNPNWSVNLNLLLMPFLFTVSMSLLQMTLCLFVKPTVSYVFSVVVCILSAYYLNPVIIGNYAMALRSNQLVSNGVDINIGIICMVILGLFSVVIGMLRFKNIAF